MAKLSNPFKDKAIRITQTSHNNLGGHSDFSLVRAIDCNPGPFDNKVYAEGDGVVIASVNAKNPNSYLHIHYNGLPGHIIRELVHVRPSVAKGAKVKRGQLVGTLEPYRANWYLQKNGTRTPHPVHLHWSFLNTNKTGAPNPFNYLDRKTKVTSREPVILNSRTWFNANGTFNWSSFGDYKLDLKAPTPIPTPPTCAAEKKKIKALEKEVANYKGIEDQLLKENQGLKDSQNEANKYTAKLQKEVKDLEYTLEKRGRDVAGYKEKMIEFADKSIELEKENKKLKKDSKRLAGEVLELEDILLQQVKEIEELEKTKACNLEDIGLKEVIQRFVIWLKGLKK